MPPRYVNPETLGAPKGYSNGGYGAGGRVLGISRVEPRSSGGLTIRGVANSGNNGGYYGYGRWGHGGGAGVGLGSILVILLIAYLLGVIH